MERVVCGLLGSRCTGEARKVWNAAFKGAGLDAFFDFYRTGNRHDAELRLSEMFLLERRGYAIDPKLQKEIVTLLDVLDTSATTEGKVDTVWNDGGVLYGFFLGATKDDKKIPERMKTWKMI
jgi:shikimate 5-dehydrogenase